MSVLSQIAEGTIAVAESCENFEPVSESTMSAVLAAALEESCNEEELDELAEQANNNLVTLSPVEERSIVKLDKKAKKQHAYRVALYKAAAEMNIKEFKQLKTLWQAEKELDRRIERRCHQRALQIMRETARQHKDSPTPKIKRAADSITRSQKKTQQALSGTVKMNARTQSQARQIASKLA